MKLRMLGNAHVFVTCECMDTRRQGWLGRSTKNRPVKARAPQWKSLGDFPVGTHGLVLKKVWEDHVDAARAQEQTGEKSARPGGGV